MILIKTLGDIRREFLNEASILAKDPENLLNAELLKNIAKADTNALQMLDTLNKLRFSDDYSALKDYFDEKIKDITPLADLEKEKEELVKEFTKKLNEYEDLLRTMNLDHSVNTKDFTIVAENGATFNTMSMTNEQLKENIDLINKRIEDLKKERKSGEALETAPTDSYTSLNGVKVENNNDPNKVIQNANNEFEKANKYMENNVSYKSDPSYDEVFAVYHQMSKEQTSDSNLTVNVIYRENGNIDLEIYYEGSLVDQSTPKYVYSFTDPDSIKNFEEDVLPHIVNAHVEGKIDKEATLDEHNNMTSVNHVDEVITISGNEEVAITVGNVINDEHTRNKDKGKQLVREMKDLNDKGLNTRAIYVILFWLGIFALITVIFLLIKK